MSSSTVVPVGQPLHGASFGQAIARYFRGYVQFSGRASRSEFFWSLLFTTLVSLVAQIPFWIVWAIFMTRVMAGAASTNSEPEAFIATSGDLTGLFGIMLLVIGLLVVVSLALTLPSFAVMWRRLQDANFHGAFSLLALVGLGILPLVLCFFESNPAGVRFDPGFAGQGGAVYGQPQPYGQSLPQPYGQQQAQPYGQEQAQRYGEPPYGQPTDDRPYSQGYPTA